LSTLLNRAHRGLFAAVIGLLCLSYLSPVATLAYGDQVPGDAAVITSSDGSGAALRETVGYDAAVLSTISDQTSISILEGPISADDGSLWYLVSAGDLSGYVDASFISSSTPVDEVPAEDVPEEEVPAEDVPAEDVPAEDVPEEEVPAEEIPVDVIPWADPVDYGVVVNNIQDGTFPEAGLACRTAANENATESYRFQIGETIEITGEEFWEGDFAWLPVNCAGAGGFVKSLYAEVAVEEAPVEETEVVTEEAPVEETEVATEEAPVEETDVVTEEAPVEETEVATEEEVVTEEVPAEETEEVVTEEGSVEDPDAVTEEVATEEVPAEGTDVATLEVVTGEDPAEVTDVATEETVADGSATEEATSTTGDVAPKGARTEDSAVDNLAPVIGTAEVQGTNGDGLVCRVSPSSDAAVINVLNEGTVVQITEQTNSEWLQIICGNQLGYANTIFLWSGGAGTDDDLAAAADGSATVSGTNGTGVRCRTSGSLSGGIITVLAEGTTVTTRGASSGGWTPVTCAGQNGFVSSEYLTVGGGGSTPTPAPGGSAGTATVSGTNGDGVRCRTSGSTSGSIITVLAEGTSVPTTGASSGGWTPVTCGGQAGFVSSQYLTVNGGGGGSTPTPTPAPGGTAGSAKVTGTNGDGVRCRTSGSTSGSIITVLAEGTTVATRGAASGGWTPVTCGGQAGFVSSQYLTVSGGGGTTPTPAPGDGGGGGSLAANDHAKVTSTLNLRYNPSMTAGIATTAPAGTVVLIVGGPDNGYYQVDWDGLGGYMHGDYLTKTSDALSERGGSGSNPDPDPDPGGGTGTGNAMVDFAMGYLGYPYVWATHGPASFDCSGFTYWVTKNVIGIDIGTGLWTQTAAGTPVSKSNLQPGDIVFFQNTYKGGLSHVGIYIGGGQFIHAENENTGVKISDLNSTYYGSRWYGAVRLG
jgi:cell wall-associated NlpC family hydrolase